jgi:hypothetical protein
MVLRRVNGPCGDVGRTGGEVMSDWHPDLPFCALILFLMIAMYAVPARQLCTERDKRRLFDQDRDNWK